MYPLIIGICSQAGVSPISIATSSSGNYNNACSLTTDNVAGLADGTNFSNGNLTFIIDHGTLNTFVNQHGIPSLNILPAGFLRWTGGGSPSFAWQITPVSSSLSNSNTSAVTGTASTSQDATGSSGIGQDMQITFAGSRPIATPADGDSVVFLIKGIATLNGVVSAAESLEVTINFG